LRARRAAWRPEVRAGICPPLIAVHREPQFGGGRGASRRRFCLGSAIHLLMTGGRSASPHHSQGPSRLPGTRSWHSVEPDNDLPLLGRRPSDSRSLSPRVASPTRWKAAVSHDSRFVHSVIGSGAVSQSLARGRALSPVTAARTSLRAVLGRPVRSGGNSRRRWRSAACVLRGDRIRPRSSCTP
jgi:hypothetical protein